MDNNNKKELKQKINNLKPNFRIGKNKISENFIEQINDNLKKNKICKIKVINEQSKEDIDIIIKEVKNKTESEVIEKKGFTFTLYKEEQ